VFAVLLYFLSVAAPPRASVSPAAEPHRVFTACTAVTRSDVELALGRRVNGGAESDSGATCDYAAGRGIVTVTVQRLREEVDFAAEIGSVRAALPGARIRPAAGLGTRAVFIELPGAGTQLHVVRQREVYVMISVLGFGEASEVSGAAESLARRALASR
jgi:hypothetical protein